MQTHVVIWNLHLALGNLPKTPYLGKMTKFDNLVPKNAQNTKKGLELVISFLNLPGVFTILMAHHHNFPVFSDNVYQFFSPISMHAIYHLF